MMNKINRPKITRPTMNKSKEQEELMIEQIQEEPIQEQEVTLEEIIEEQPKEEVLEEEPKQKTKKKSTKKSSNKKQEDQPEETIEKEVLPNMSLKDAMIAMNDEINIEEEGWTEIKQEIIDKLKTTVIDPDISPTDMRYLAAEIDSILTDLKIYKVDVENKVKALSERMEYIKAKSAVGSNSEQRKATGYEALFNHKKNPNDTESINLVQIKLVLEGQLNFYNSSVETLMSRKSLLVTFLGAVKLEASI